MRLGDSDETDAEQTQLQECPGTGWQNRFAALRFNCLPKKLPNCSELIR